jgi:hypothetical protein
MRRHLLVFLFAALSLAAFSQADARDLYVKPIIGFLESKAYQGDQRQYADADLAVSSDVQEALDRLGLSRFTVIRNEIWARHGYVFKTALLDYLFRKVAWYRPDPAFGMGSLTGMPARNADWIKTKEDVWDYENLGSWLSNRPYKGDIETYLDDEYYALPESVRISANHLGLKPARLLRNEIFARADYAFQDSTLMRVFSYCRWYKPRTPDAELVSGSLGITAKANVALCAQREVLDNLESVTYSLPEGVDWIPTMDYGALFIREFKGSDGETYHYSSIDLWDALAFKPESMSTKAFDPDGLVPPAVVQAIKDEANPLKKLVLYFSNKGYAGVADALVFNTTAFSVPSYLAAAVSSLKLDWNAVLRKEIHARHGAIFSDPKIGPIFQACPWYKAQYRLATARVSRFPVQVKLTAAELANFALLEGRSLAPYRDLAAQGKPKIVVDLAGGVYQVSVDYYQSEGQTLTVAILYPLGTYPSSAKEYIRQLLRDIGVENPDLSPYFGAGC